MTVFNPSGSLNVATDASEIKDDDFVRCKNLRIDQKGLVKTRDGSTKLNATAINTAVWHIEEQDGDRYAFAGANIYKNETSIQGSLTSAQWSAMQYNAFNDTEKNIFALNGTDRKRIEGGVVYEWGIDAPTVAPTLTTGGGSGLTGQYNAKYTYVRKVGTAIVHESDPSPAADNPVVLEDESLAVAYTDPSDAQVTHIRLYRTLKGGEIYYLDQEVVAALTYTHGYVFDWEATDAYISGTGNKFTITDATHGTENTFTWEDVFEDRDDEDTTSTSGSEVLVWPDIAPPGGHIP
ncbi:hypothetical protein LCGC14_2710680 [marine sediment metagenome]|uniref:Uncharacterized protein n=1 Tax=marine sediment metagenome TaxID=412755 RepID=A0A0F8ZCY2_9ZZZZ